MVRRLAAILAADVVGYSRLMGEDESGTLARLNSVRKGIIEPIIAQHRGRVAKLLGDGLLVEFPSVVDAVECALAWQRAVNDIKDASPADQRIKFRIGINLGDLIVEDDDIFGDGVNVAARIEAVAEAGGICISEDAYRQARGRVSVGFADLGRRQFKNIREPVRVFALTPSDVTTPILESESRPQQEIRYCNGSDGIRLAYASVGKGPPVVKASNWLSHLEHEWENPLWRHWFTELSARNRLIRYDERGVGLSDWEVEDISMNAFVEDLEAVVAATGVTRFPLVGISQGCAISIAYAVRHPEQVSGLILYGGYAAGWHARGNEEEIERRRVLEQMIRVGWGQNNPAFRQVFTTLFVPGATDAQKQWFNELERISTSPENAVRHHRAFGDIDVRGLLAEVRAPTLVLHALGDCVVPFESGRELAKTIPNARFVPLESENHILLETEDAWPYFQSELRSFLSNLDDSSRI